MSHPFILARAAMLPCVIVLTAACTFETGIEQEYSKSFALSARAEVRVQVANALVRVTTTAEPKVDIRVRYETTDSASVPPFATRQDGHVIELREDEDAHNWWNWNSARVDHAVIEVRLPKNADLQLHTSNGAIEVSGLDGDIRLHTSNGAITATALHGKLQASSSNGSINVEGVDGGCEISTSNGTIHVTGRFDSLDIHSSNGHVVARATAGSTVPARWTIDTSNAAVDLSLPSDLKADLDMVTSNGALQLEIPLTVRGVQDQSHIHGALNGGGQEVSVHTSNGPIHVNGA